MVRAKHGRCSVHDPDSNFLGFDLLIQVETGCLHDSGHVNAVFISGFRVVTRSCGISRSVTSCFRAQ